MNNKIQLPLHIHLIIIFFGIVLFFFVLIVWASILIPLAFGLVFSLFLYPLCKRIENRGLPKILAILICLLLIVIILTLIISLIYSNLLSFSADFPKMKERTQDLVHSSQASIEEYFKISSEKQATWLNANINTFIKTGGTVLNGFVDSATTFFTYMLLIPIYIFFMLYYRYIFKEFIHKIIDFEHLTKAAVIEAQIVGVIQKYISGLFTVILIVTVLNIIGLSLIGIRHAIFFGTLAAFLTVIPYIGVFIGSLLPILYALVMTDSLYYPIAVFIWFQIVQGLEGNFITPNIIGSQVSINPLVAIIALLIGSMVWGIAGMILFVPFVAMLKVFLDNIPSLAPYGYLLSEGKENKSRKKTRKRTWFSFFKKKG